MRVGDPLPDLTLADAHGRPLALATLRGHVVCLDFWASWCGHCKTALPALDAVARRHAARGLTVVAVDVDQSRAPADRFLAERLPDPALTLLYDPDARALARFAPAGMPALYLVDPAGTVRLVEAGYDPTRLGAIEREIERALEAAGR